MSNEAQEKDLDISKSQDIKQLDLSEKVAQLEKKLDLALMLISDIYLYGNLRDFLSAGKWREADLETARVMLEASGHTDKENLTPDDVIKFPCSVINVIDQLWIKYSNGRFGFSIQKKIYESMGGTYDISKIDLKVLNMTCEKLGLQSKNKWIPYENLNFSLEAPHGCFPFAWWNSPYGAKSAVYFLARLNDCDIY